MPLDSLCVPEGITMEPILTLIAVLGGLNLLSLAALAFWIRIHIENSLIELDEKLAMAIKGIVDKLVEGGLGDFEPPNPIQGAIAQLIQGIATQKMNTIDATVMSRGSDGQFQSKIDEFQ